MKKVIVVDYGVGNLLSVARAFENRNAEVILTSDPQVISKADRLVLPGVGAFGDCMHEISKRNLVEPILDFIDTKRPLLGICVGMQVLHSLGLEFGEHDGLKLINGVVDKIPNQSKQGVMHKIPHIGWAKLQINQLHSQDAIAQYLVNQWFYFVHGFMATPQNPDHVLAVYDYNGVAITACTHKDNIYGFQFHPEKSGESGLKLLEQFLTI